MGIDRFFVDWNFQFKAFYSNITHMLYNKKNNILFLLGVFILNF